MIKNNYVLRDSGGDTILIGRDVIGENITPGVMWIVRNISCSTLDDTSGSDRADVVTLTVVVPGDYLRMIINTPYLAEDVVWKKKSKPR